MGHFIVNFPLFQLTPGNANQYYFHFLFSTTQLLQNVSVKYPQQAITAAITTVITTPTSTTTTTTAATTYTNTITTAASIIITL